MKAVFFDFDGTLTYKNHNIWKSIWQKCGYETDANSYYASLFRKFKNSQIAHQEWCDLTCEKFKEAGFTYGDLRELSKQIKLAGGIEETFKTLKENGFHLYIISGNIKSVISEVLGDNVKYLEDIKANEMIFDGNGIIEEIRGTKYDFVGKAKFISEFKEKTGSSAKDLFFVGNGNNDEWAHLSSCTTICVNPDETDAANNTKWHKCAGDIDDLREILGYILQKIQ